MLSPQLNSSLSHQIPGPGYVDRIERLRFAAKTFGEALEQNAAPSRERSLAVTNLEQSLMWAIKGVVLEGAAPKEKA